MRRALLTIAELVLGVIVLAVITNLIANFIDLPFWLVLVSGLFAFAALIAVTLALLRQPAEPTPSSSSPYQASRPLPEFTGRTDELKRLEKTLKPGTKTAITGLVGMGGLGKTELAKLAASRVARRFREGVLWADCAEQDLATLPDRWAAACGVQLPGDDPQTKAAAWRDWVADKRVLLIFDNVQPGQNLEPLLPVSDTPAVLITTRDTQHPALLGAELLRLDQFTLGEALALAAEILGHDKARGQEAEAERLFGLVGYLPLAVNVSLQLARECNYPLAHLNNKLEAAGALEALGERERLERSLNATFETAWDNLGDLQDAFRTLSLFNQGPSFSIQAFADTLGVDEAEGGALLYRLAGRSLLTAETGSRWSLHPLLREFVDSLEHPVDQAGHLRRARHYEQVARAADNQYMEGGDHALRALALFDLEWAHIRAGQAWAAAHAQEDDEAARLCSAYPDAVANILPLRLPLRNWIAWIEPALEAARRLGDQQAESYHLNNLGMAYQTIRESDRAIELYKQSLVIKEQLGDIRGTVLSIAQTYGNLGSVHQLKGEWDRAIEHLEQALGLFEQLGDIHGMATTYNNMGLVYAGKGEYDRAIELYEQSLASKERVGDIRGMAQTTNNLGLVYAGKGEWGRAIEFYEQALKTLEQVGDIHGMALTYGNLGVVYRYLGDTARAREYLTQALSVFESLGAPEADQVRRLLSQLDD